MGAPLVGNVMPEAMRPLGTLGDKLDSIAMAIGHYRLSLLDIVSTIAALLAVYVAARLIFWLVGRALRRSKRLDAGQQLLVEKVLALVIFGFAFFVAIGILGINVASLAVFSGAVGLAIGFGLQKTFGNLIAGLILLMDRSVKPGDVIVVGEHFGTINKIGVRAVSVITRDGKEHLIPNELLMTEPVENWSYSSRDVRIHIPVGVSYSSDLDQVTEILLRCANVSKRVLRSPKPTVWLRDFGESSVNFEIRVWIRDPEDGIANVRSEVLRAVWDAFKDGGIQIPFPQRDIHMKTMPAEVAKA